MAIIKKVTLDNGVEICYWHIGVVKENFIERCTEVVLFGYVSEEMRKAGKEHVMTHLVNIVDRYTTGADRAALYGCLSEFGGISDEKAVKTRKSNSIKDA